MVYVRAIVALGVVACASELAGAQAIASASFPSIDARTAAFPDLGAMDARHMMVEDPFTTLVLLDELEGYVADHKDTYSWDFEAWAGRGINKLWLRSEGERSSGSTEHAEISVLGSRAVGRWWDIVAGVRRDVNSAHSRSWAAFGIQGLAPYQFEVEATAFIGDGRQAALRFDVEYEFLITQRLILEPSVELNWYVTDDIDRSIASGLAASELGLRLRYEIRREFAPYIGVTRIARHGDSAELGRADGVDRSETRWVTGVRIWF